MIIPAILAKTSHELREKIRRAENFPGCRLVQLDIMDGRFVKNKSISARAIQKIQTRLNLELHLMIQDPEKQMLAFVATRAKRIIVHFESSKRLKELFSTLKQAKINIGLALNPKTPLEEINPFVQDIDFLLLMAVDPGQYGSLFQSSVYRKICQARKQTPRLPIEIDGGVSLDNILKLHASGADRFVVGSRIFLEKDPSEAYKQFRSVLRSSPYDH